MGARVTRTLSGAVCAVLVLGIGALGYSIGSRVLWPTLYLFEPLRARAASFRACVTINCQKRAVRGTPKLVWCVGDRCPITTRVQLDAGGGVSPNLTGLVAC